MTAPDTCTTSAPPALAELAAGIRECVATLQNDLEIIRECAGKEPGCADALKRAGRQVAEIIRLVNELQTPPGYSA